MGENGFVEEENSNGSGKGGFKGVEREEGEREDRIRKGSWMKGMGPILGGNRYEERMDIGIEEGPGKEGREDMEGDEQR